MRSLLWAACVGHVGAHQYLKAEPESAGLLVHPQTSHAIYFAAAELPRSFAMSFAPSELLYHPYLQLLASSSSGGNACRALEDRGVSFVAHGGGSQLLGGGQPCERDCAANGTRSGRLPLPEHSCGTGAAEQAPWLEPFSISLVSSCGLARGTAFEPASAANASYGFAAGPAAGLAPPVVLVAGFVEEVPLSLLVTLGWTIECVQAWSVDAAWVGAVPATRTHALLALHGAVVALFLLLARQGAGAADAPDRAAALCCAARQALAVVLLSRLVAIWAVQTSCDDGLQPLAALRDGQALKRLLLTAVYLAGYAGARALARASERWAALPRALAAAALFALSPFCHYAPAVYVLGAAWCGRKAESPSVPALVSAYRTQTGPVSSGAF